MKEFPKSVTASDGYDRLQEALIGTRFHLVKGRAAEKAISLVRKAAGYSAYRTINGWIWERVTSKQSINTTHIQ